MKSEHVRNTRVSPYVVPKKEMDNLVGYFAGKRVREALSAGWTRAKEVGYKVFKAAPLLYLAAPNPLTGALAVANAVDTLIRVRNGDKIGLLEAALVVASGLKGAAAQVSYKYIGENFVMSNATNDAPMVDCLSDRALRTQNPTQQTNFTYCDLQTGTTGFAPIHDFDNQTVGIISTEAELQNECPLAFEACAPGRNTSNATSASMPFSSPLATSIQATPLTTFQATSTPFTTPSSSLSLPGNTTSLIGSTAGATSSLWPSTTQASSAVKTSSYAGANGATSPIATSTVLPTVTSSAKQTSVFTLSTNTPSATGELKTTSSAGTVSTSASQVSTPAASTPSASASDSASVLGSPTNTPSATPSVETTAHTHPEIIQANNPDFILSPLSFFGGGVMVGVALGSAAGAASLVTYCFTKNTKNKVVPTPLTPVSYAMEMIVNPLTVDTLGQEASESLQISRV